jgi:lysophospholipase L1-like esterase
VQLYVLAGGMSLALFLLVLELGLRIYNPIHVPLRANDIVLPVNNRFQFKNDSNFDKVDKVVVNTYNSLGFRGAPPPPPKDFDAATTVLTVGGSTTACVGLSDGKTWPDLVAAKLSGEFPSLWLNNAGMDGHSTFGHLVLLKQVVSVLKPDFVLYLTGVNDVGRGDLNDWDKGLETESASLGSSIVKHSELLSTIQVVSRTFRAIDLGVFQRKDVDVAKHPRNPIDDAAMEAVLAEHRAKHVPGYRARMLQLIQETRKAGIEPILLTQPALYGDVVDPTANVALGDLEFFAGEDTSNARLQWRVLELYNDVLRSLGTEQRVHVIELAHQMPKDSKYYTDWIHYSRAGAERVAAIVAEGLRPVLQQGSEHEHTRNFGVLSR